MATTMVETKAVDLKSAEPLKLQITRVIQASRQRTFDAWTRPDYIRQWFGSGRTVLEADTDPSEGGAYRILMGGGACDSTGAIDMSRNSTVSGRYVKVVPYDLLSFNWAGDWNPTEETLVTITFKDAVEGTELTLTHERFTSELSRNQHEQGWINAILSFKKFVEGA